MLKLVSHYFDYLKIALCSILGSICIITVIVRPVISLMIAGIVVVSLALASFMYGNYVISLRLARLQHRHPYRPAQRAWLEVVRYGLGPIRWLMMRLIDRLMTWYR
jgi:hypothetical protein